MADSSENIENLSKKQKKSPKFVVVRRGKRLRIEQIRNARKATARYKQTQVIIEPEIVENQSNNDAQNEPPNWQTRNTVQEIKE